MHPLDGRGSRRQFLQRTGGAAAGLSAAAWLAACSNTTTTAPAGSDGGSGGPGGFPLARPDRPVTLPRWEDPIDSGMQPETGGTFTIFNYPEYFYQPLMKKFGEKYGVTVQVTPFDDINSGISRLAAGSVAPDVMEMTPDNVNRVVASKLIKPLNLDYIPNLKKNVWPALVDPFYDGGARYTVPYTIYTTGIVWRNDKVKEDTAGWTTPGTSSGRRRSTRARWRCSTTSARRSRWRCCAAVHDVNTENANQVNAAVADLKQLYDIGNVKMDDNQYQTIPETSVAEPGLVGRHHVGRASTTCRRACRAPSCRLLAAGQGLRAGATNDCFASARPPRTRCSPTCSSTTCSTTSMAFSNFVDFRLPAAAQRDRPRRRDQAQG